MNEQKNKRMNKCICGENIVNGVDWDMCTNPKCQYFNDLKVKSFNRCPKENLDKCTRCGCYKNHDVYEIGINDWEIRCRGCGYIFRTKLLDIISFLFNR